MTNDDQFELFHKTLLHLGQSGVLSDIILIGSWCLFFYRILFKDAIEFGALRTTDIDFLIPNPPRIKNKADIPSILASLGFTEAFSSMSGDAKFVHPDLEIEFLLPEKGRGSDKPYYIKELNVNAQRMRYIHLLQKYVIPIQYKNLTIHVPEPAVFVLHKFQVSQTRKKKEKEEKDIEAATELGNYLILLDEQNMRLSEIYYSLPGKWQKDILKVIKQHSESIYKVLI